MEPKSSLLTLPERLKRHWGAHGVKIRPGVSEEELRNFETAHGVRFSQDLRDYFRAVDGMEEGTMATDYFSFWPLHTIKRMSEELGPECYADVIEPDQYFIFADYCIWCWGYAIRLTGNHADSNPVFFTGNRPDNGRIIASSFTEFLELYLTDEAHLY